MSMTFLLVLATVSVATVLASTDKIVCYHGTWSVDRPGDGRFGVENIDPCLCTHLIYAFVGVNGDNGSVITLEPERDLNEGNFKKFTDLKKKNSKLKTLLAVGGWNEGSVNYSKIAGDAYLRAEFVRSALNWVKTYNFDGFDVDWEYPGQRGGVPEDKENFVLLIKELTEAFHKCGLIITAAVAATGSGVDISYDVPQLNKYIDWFNLMTYDLHGSWDGVTGNNAPLYASSRDTTESAKLLNVAASVEGWIKRGASPKKLVLGMPLYGRTFTLNSTDVSIGAPTQGPGLPGQFTQEAGTLGYNEICLLLNQGWPALWDDEQQVPHTYKGDQWISCDNVKSIGLKIDYAQKQKLGGVMLWSIETDDFRAACGGPANPILTSVKQNINGEGSSKKDY